MFKPIVQSNQFMFSGQRIEMLDDLHVAGPGTYVHNRHIISSVAGVVATSKAPHGKVSALLREMWIVI